MTLSTGQQTQPDANGAYRFENLPAGGYNNHWTRNVVVRPDGVYQSQQRFGLYRWHILDPIRFEPVAQWPGPCRFERRVGR